MDATRTYFALRESGVKLALSGSNDRLHARPAESLTSHLAAALAENHEQLLREELLRRVLSFVAKRLRKRDGNPERSDEESLRGPCRTAGIHLPRHGEAKPRRLQGDTP